MKRNPALTSTSSAFKNLKVGCQPVLSRCHCHCHRDSLSAAHRRGLPRRFAVGALCRDISNRHDDPFEPERPSRATTSRLKPEHDDTLEVAQAALWLVQLSWQHREGATLMMELPKFTARDLPLRAAGSRP
jgi:hypothetical protein